MDAPESARRGFFSSSALRELVTPAHAGDVLLALLPGALTAYLAFHQGGYLALPTATVTVAVLLVIAARAMLADQPGRGLSRAVAVPVGLLALFALWTLLSGTWSHSYGRALVEFDRALLYASVFALFASVGRRPALLAWMVGFFVVAVLVVCGVAISARLFPDLWSSANDGLSKRLNWPLGYWNALGLLATLGIVICFGTTADHRARSWLRVLAAAPIPMLAATLYLTLSRGSILACGLGLLVVAVAVGSRALVSALAAVVPTAGVALVVAWHAKQLVSETPVAGPLRDQGHRLALVIAVCVVAAVVLRAVLLRADAALGRVALGTRARRLSVRGGAVAAIVVAGVAFVALDIPHRFNDRISATAPAAGVDPATIAARNRLETLDPDGRIDHWKVAWHVFEEHPLVGRGAGTYALSWAARRPNPVEVKDAHSLYVEVLSELGVVGFFLVVAALLTLVLGLAQYTRGEHRGLYATLLAATVTWMAAAGLDWHWEVPAVTLWLFALGGAAVSSPAPDPARANAPRRLPRIAVAAACCLLAAVIPARIAVSSQHTEDALSAFVSGDCAQTGHDARLAIKVLGARSEPYELLGYCDLAGGEPAAALQRVHQAIHRDPDAWRPHYELALLRAGQNLDPRPAIQDAHRLDPLEPVVLAAMARFSGHPRSWKQAATGLSVPLPIASP